MKEKLKKKFRSSFLQTLKTRFAISVYVFIFLFHVAANAETAIEKDNFGLDIKSGLLAEVKLPGEQSVKTVSGTVADEKGETLPGVNVVVKGTTNGTITNIDGEYSIEIQQGATLVFSFIGFINQEVLIGDQVVIDIVLLNKVLSIDEVVVTAMGISQEKKRLNFAVQAVDADEITRDKQANFVDALQGRIAGVEISGTGGSPNASSQILIRGASSINTGKSNEPIFILNGMHISGGASKAAEINPNDIENVTILKGAAAAALYGQEAANGAIMITTKSGKDGVIEVQLSSSFQLDQPYRIPDQQNMYLRGGLGVYREESKGGWGPLMPEGTKTYNNVDNYLKTGFFQKHDLSVSGGNEKFTTYGSASYTNHKGIVPEDYLKRFSILLKSDYNIRENLSLGFMADISQRESRGAGSMGSIYSWPIDDDMRNYKNPDGSIRWLYVNPNNRYYSPLNPNWSRYEDSGKSISYRTLIQGTVNWSPIKNLDITGRVGYDLTNSESLSTTTPRWNLDPGLEPTAEDLPFLGSMFYYDGKSTMLNYGAFALYEVQLSSDFSLNLLAGADFKQQRSRSARMGGRDFIVPGFESINNLNDIRKESIRMSRREYNIFGLFGEAKLDYKGLVQLGVTGRNDHTSTLPENVGSYFYPSFSGGLIFTELFNIESSVINFGKLRGNWAQVGKDTGPYQQNDYYKPMPHPDGGYGVDPTRSSNLFLEPEFTTSWELGISLRMFNDKTHLDFAYYSTFVDNQIVVARVSPASGKILQTRNEGDISNKGIEITWDQKIISNGSFTWNMTTNFAHNKGTVGSLPDNVTEIYHYAGQIGDIRPSSYLHGPVFAITGKDYLRTDDEQIIVDENGFPKINSGSALLIGNREADFNIGWQNYFQYSNWSLSVLINMRKGGDVVNGTLKSLMSNGMAKNLEDYRNRQILVEGVVEQPDGTFSPNTNPVIFDQLFYQNYYAPVGSNFIEDASFVRLANVTLSYDMSKLSKKIGVKGLKLSLTGRNLFLMTNYSGSDPVVNYTGTSGGAGTFGVDNLPVPNPRSFLFNISANF